MKRINFLFFLFVFFAVITLSCKKDKDTGAEKFSTLTVEQNKASVENAGIDLVTTMTEMKSIQTVDVLFNLGDLLSNAGTKKAVFSKESKIISTLETFVSAAKGEKKLNDVFVAMASAKDLADDPQSIQEFWDTNVGTYNWNPGLNDFDITLGGDKFIFLFPSSDVAATNDATFTIYNYEGVIISNPLDEDYTGDLPIGVNADLKVGSKTLVTYLFSASYNTDGVPNAIASDLTIENYKFEIDISNDTKLVSVNFKFLQDNKVIMDMGAAGKGLFTQANIDASTHTHSETYTYISDYVWNSNTQSWDPVYTSYVDTWEETDGEEILNSANAHFQLFNVAIRGEINVKGLVDQLKLIDTDLSNEVITSEEADALYAQNINKYLNLRLVNTTSNEIMAKAQAYVVNETDYYGNAYTSVDLRLTFADGSPIDVQTYFDSGFNNFVNELNIFITGVNSDFNVDIQPVEY
jgi:hypothetical protein